MYFTRTKRELWQSDNGRLTRSQWSKHSAAVSEMSVFIGITSERFYGNAIGCPALRNILSELLSQSALYGRIDGLTSSSSPVVGPDSPNTISPDCKMAKDLFIWR